MSFSFSFTASSIERAKALVADQHAPQMVKDFIATALDGLRTAQVSQNTSQVYSVLAEGHLCDDASKSYEVTTARIEVKRIVVT